MVSFLSNMGQFLLIFYFSTITLNFSSFGNTLFQNASVSVNLCCPRSTKCVDQTDLNDIQSFFGLTDLNLNFTFIDHQELCNDTESIVLPYDKRWTEFEVTKSIEDNNQLIVVYNNTIFLPDKNCIKKTDQNVTGILVCKNKTRELEAQPSILLVDKCCEFNQVWNLSRYPALKCQSSQTKWSPNVYTDVYAREPLHNQSVLFRHADPKKWCKNPPHIMSLRGLANERPYLFKFLENGELWFKIHRRKWMRLERGNYCIDGAANFPLQTSSIPNEDNFSGNYIDTIVVDCSPPVSTFKTMTSTLYGICMIICSCFLILTLVVYILQWEKQNVHGWALMCYFTALLFMYIFLATTHFASVHFQSDGSGTGPVCYAIAVGAHFFFISSFCWMTVVNFDLWWTFRALMPTAGRSKGIKRFSLYTLFGVGIPVLIIALGLILEFQYREDLESEVIIPEYGKTECFLNKEYALLPYIYVPIGILLSSNLIFYCVTVYSMYKVQQSTKFATSSSSKTAQDKKSMLLFLKLFLVMGVPWMSEFLGWWFIKTNEESPWYVIVLDIINIFQAFFIFLIFAAKPETIYVLETKFPSFGRLMKRITFTPHEAQEILTRRPFLKCVITPFVRTSRDFKENSASRSQTTLSTDFRRTKNAKKSLGAENPIKPDDIPMKGSSLDS